MSVAKIIEITASSPNGFEDAIQRGIARAAETVSGIQGAWVAEQKVVVNGGRVVEYRVTLKVSFLLSGGEAEAPAAKTKGGKRKK